MTINETAQPNETRDTLKELRNTSRKQAHPIVKVVTFPSQLRMCWHIHVVTCISELQNKAKSRENRPSSDHTNMNIQYCQLKHVQGWLEYMHTYIHTYRQTDRQTDNFDKIATMPTRCWDSPLRQGPSTPWLFEEMHRLCQVPASLGWTRQFVHLQNSHSSKKP